MPISTDEQSKNAFGGTENMKNALANKVSPKLLEQFQIIPSRVREMDPSLIPVYWLHDLPEDPESAHLAKGGWTKFHKLVFVSNWQMQRYIARFGIPWYKCLVLNNAIEPIPVSRTEKAVEDEVRIIYHTTPHRGLGLLVEAFKALANEHNVHLDVFSSFEIYGWKQRDEPYQQLFDECRNHPKITYHGFQSNEVVRQYLSKAHIFAYPSIWQETSCIALMEAMSAGCVCIHPNYAALPETASHFTRMYQFYDDPRDHVQILYQILKYSIKEVSNNSDWVDNVWTAKSFADTFYSWGRRVLQWEQFLKTCLLEKGRGIPC